MFASQVAVYNDNRLVGTQATTAQSNFDRNHPIFSAIAQLARLRGDHIALRRGKQIVRQYGEKPGLFAVSRIDPESGARNPDRLQHVNRANRGERRSGSSNTRLRIASWRLLPETHSARELFSRARRVKLRDVRRRSENRNMKFAFSEQSPSLADDWQRPSISRLATRSRLTADPLPRGRGADFLRLSLQGEAAHSAGEGHDRKTATLVLADLEHVFRFSGHSVRLRAPERQRQPHLSDTRRRLDQIPILWIAAPLTGLIVQPIVGYCSDRTWTRLGRRRPYFLCRRDRRDARAVRHAEFAGAVDCGGHALDTRCVDQCLHGAVSRLRRRSVADVAAARRLCDAELFHRRRLGGGEPAAVDAREDGRRQHGGAGRRSRYREVRVLLRRRDVVHRRGLDGVQHARVRA